MASGATLAPRTEQLDPPPIDGRSGDAPPKPTNSLELGWEPLSDGPNEGAPHKVGTLHALRPMAAERRPQKAIPRGSGLAIEAPRRAWRAR
jgi:hypothetical protein